MAFENEAIYSDITALANSRAPADIWKYEAEIITPDKDVEAIRVDGIHYNRDYVSSYGDMVLITLTLGAFTYKRDIYPHRENLKIKVTRSRKGESGSDVSFGDVSYQIYTATLTTAPDIDKLAKLKESDRAAEDEAANQLDFTFQLNEEALFTSRLAEFGGIFRESTIKDVLRVGMGYGLNGGTSIGPLKEDTFTGIRGVEISEPANSGVIDPLIIPVGTRIIDLPDYIQKNYGIYSSGLGVYLQAGKWFVYPTRDYTLFNKKPSTLTIVNVPENEMPAIERSYRKDGKKIFVLSTGSSTMTDVSRSSMLNKGNGMRYVRASALMDLMGVPSENKVTLERDKTLKETSIAEPVNGHNNIRWAKGRITNNPYPEISNLTEGLGHELTLTWQNSNQSLLYPGMPVKVLYMKNGLVKESVGTLTGVQTVITTATTGMTDTEYRSNSTLKVFVKPE